MRRIILALSMLIGVWLGTAISAPSASAATNCNMAVVDFTSDGVLGDTSRIEAAIEKLEDQGVDVRVRAFETTPGGSLEAYQKEQVQICPTWQDPNGRTKGNLMTFLFSMDRQSAIFYGSNLEAELGDEVDRIRADYMNAEFRKGNFSEGIIGAISESASVIDEYNHPSPDVSTENDNSTSSSDSSVFGWVMGVVGGLVILALLVFGAYKLIKLWQRRREEHRAAGLAAQRTADMASVALVNLTRTWGVKQRTEALSPKLNDEDRAELGNLVEDFYAVEETAVSLNENIVADPATYSLEERRSTAEYRSIEAAYEEVRAYAAEAASTMDKIEAFCAEKEDGIVRAPETVQARRTALDELAAKCAALEQEGYRFTLTESFAKVDALLDEAEREIDAKRYGQALDELDDSRGYLDDIQRILTRVPEWHQGLQKEHAALTDELGEAKKAVATAMEIRKDISSQFTNCDEGLLSESEAAELIATVAASLAEAKNECSMERQQWAVADQRLSTCEQMLVELQQGCVAIDARMSQLTELDRNLGSRIGNLDDDILDYTSACSSREGSQREYVGRLRSASMELAELVSNLGADKPSLLHIDREFTKLKSKVESIEAESEEEDRKTRRRRREAEEAERRRRDSYNSSSGVGIGFAAGSAFGGSSGGGGFDFGSGSSGGSDGGGSSGSW